MGRVPATRKHRVGHQSGTRGCGSGLSAPRTNRHHVLGNKASGAVGARWGATPSPRRVVGQRSYLRDARRLTNEGNTRRVDSCRRINDTNILYQTYTETRVGVTRNERVGRGEPHAAVDAAFRSKYSEWRWKPGLFVARRKLDL